MTMTMANTLGSLGSSEPRATPAVGRWLQELEAALQSLQKETEALECKLQPVMNYNLSEHGAVSMNVAVPDTACPLAQTLMELVSKVSSAREQIVNMQRAVEL
jgi:hypothetical protein